ncbi:DUF4166 domain-containing protein [Rhodanobacter glycinis]|uniref:DUF4166 domain-containing protein n=1 Tax=Rhodanobacter glycinis TaxID=582702 RepID=A0A502CFI5_9GAMM|nr:DUF4166 domain-containing protein [Rhodanobacter glycinis]TPG11553.1 DUF4166 domain-containing protein [Rhodanobacter glycinis]TPG47595.1 DUF4166 domain-containing protein [Rhodanobacter glycinis]
MTSNLALFPALLGERWHQLVTPVQQMHGNAPHVLARGAVDVEGATNLPIRWLRHLLGLPEPGLQQPLEVTIERRDTCEIWTRRFASKQMRSVLDRVTNSPLLSERLGPITLHFELLRDDTVIDWQLRSVRMFGLRLPRALFGNVLSRSGAQDDRYAFHIDTRLPLLGRLVAYRGWLEIVDGD